MPAINTQYIKDNILPLYPDSTNMKRVSKRKFIYNNDQLFDEDFQPVTDSNGKIIELNGKLNWRCYNTTDGDEPIFVIDDGNNVLYHGELSGIPLSCFEINVELNEDDGSMVHADDGHYMFLFFVLTIDLEFAGIYNDDIRESHIAGLNHLLTATVTQLDNAMENVILAIFDENINDEKLPDMSNYYFNLLKQCGLKSVDTVER